MSKYVYVPFVGQSTRPNDKGQAQVLGLVRVKIKIGFVVL